MSLLNEALAKIGNLILTGIQGTDYTLATQNLFKDYPFLGLIYFGHNYQSPEQIASLSLNIQKNHGNSMPLFLSTDHEGGRVQRFKEGFTKLPPAFNLGRTGSPKLIFDVSEAIALELKAVGINLNFAPVADIFTEPTNPVIGDRSFAEDAESVAKMVSAFVRGHLTGGVEPCVKHFPGHGDTTVDSHFELPQIKHSLNTLRKREFIPFIRAIRSKCNFVMSAHIVNSEIDPKFPGTLSSATLQSILREELRFEKVIVSDDLEMHAITKNFGSNEAPILALNAGCDLLLYRTPEAAVAAFESIERALQNKTLDPVVVIEASARIEAVQKKMAETYVLPDPKTVASKLKRRELLDLMESVSPPMH